jgi:hypothetical protein
MMIFAVSSGRKENVEAYVSQSSKLRCDLLKISTPLSE